MPIVNRCRKDTDNIMTNKLLIVDDDRELLKMLKQYFEHKGYLVMLAENGEEDLEKVSRQR